MTGECLNSSILTATDRIVALRILRTSFIEERFKTLHGAATNATPTFLNNSPVKEDASKGEFRILNPEERGEHELPRVLDK